MKHEDWIQDLDLRVCEDVLWIIEDVKNTAIKENPTELGKREILILEQFSIMIQERTIQHFHIGCIEEHQKQLETDIAKIQVDTEDRFITWYDGEMEWLQ